MNSALTPAELLPAKAAALLALSHNPPEQRLYEALAAQAAQTGSPAGLYSLGRLLSFTGMGSYSTLRRARAGLIGKKSIDCEDGRSRAANNSYHPECFYTVYAPAEVFERRERAGVELYPKALRNHLTRAGYTAAIERVVVEGRLTQSEAMVALCCSEGLTNGEIGDELCVSEQTVKFHLRRVFAKFGVQRRGELISRLLRSDDGHRTSSSLRAPLPSGESFEVTA